MKKGVAYIIEGVAALIIILGFVIALAPSQEDVGGEWSVYQDEVLADDISQAMKDSGTLDRFATRGDVGSIRVLGEELSRDLGVSGTMRRIPAGNVEFGWIITDDEVSERELIEVESSHECYGELDEINNTHPESPILRTEDEENGAYLYVTDTDPEEPFGTPYIERPDYDTLWVDNGTRCEFEDEDGPFYEDDFFFYGDGSQGEFKEAKQFTEDTLTLHLANLPAQTKFELEDSLEEIMSGIRFNTVHEDEAISESHVIIVRDLSVFESIDEESYIEEEGSLIVMNDLDEGEFEDHFEDYGVEWLDEEIQEDENDEIDFGSSSLGENIGDFFRVSQADRTDVELTSDLPLIPDRDVAGVRREPEVLARDGFEDNGSRFLDDLNDESEPLEDLPASDCTDIDHYHTETEFLFKENEVDVVATPVSTDSDCRGTWLVSLDREGDGSVDSDLGQLRHEENVRIGEEEYSIQLSEGGDYGGEITFTLEERLRPPLALSSPVYDGVDSNKAIFMPGVEPSNNHDYRLIGSIIVGSAPTPYVFGQEGEHIHEVETPGRIEAEEPMYYDLTLRWSR